MLPDSFIIIDVNIGGTVFKIAQPSDPEELLNKLLQNDKDHIDLIDERIPYWADLWPSAIGLSEFILEHPEFVKGKSVLEIGCGLGLAGIVAAKIGSKVTLSDYLQPAIDFAEYNWRLNLLTEPDLRLLDWRNPGKIIPYDVLIASDIAYEKKSFDDIIKSLSKLVKKNGVIILSEPNRDFAKEFFIALKNSGFNATKDTRNVLKDSIKYRISVYIIKKSLS